MSFLKDLVLELLPDKESTGADLVAPVVKRYMLKELLSAKVAQLKGSG